MSRFTHGDRVVLCPPYEIKGHRGEEGVVEFTPEVGGKGKYWIDWEGNYFSCWPSQIKHPSECDRCRYRLNKIVGKCPDELNTTEEN